MKTLGLVEHHLHQPWSALGGEWPPLLGGVCCRGLQTLFGNTGWGSHCPRGTDKKRSSPECQLFGGSSLFLVRQHLAPGSPCFAHVQVQGVGEGCSLAWE